VKLRVALAGNANVGKSALFNYLSGLHQHMGNWPGKTIEKAEGTLKFRGHQIDIIDLPGIYSLSTFSTEEVISRQYIAKEKPDIVINVIDSSVLERNLFFTLQLLELEAPLVIALNMADLAKERGVHIHSEKLSKKLGVPVIPIIATKGTNVSKLMEAVVKSARHRPKQIRQAFRADLEKEISEISKEASGLSLGYPPTWIAIKLLEGDKGITKRVQAKSPALIKKIEKILDGLKKTTGQDGSVVISSERYAAAERIARECMYFSKSDVPLSQKLDAVLLNRFSGYLFLLAIAAAAFFFIFIFGDFASQHLLEYLGALKESLRPLLGSGILQSAILDGVLEGIIAGLSIALPYLIPFYIILAILEDSGYLARMAFLMDAAMQKIGLHGKAFIPILLAYGCNVPACLSCRVLELQRDRLLASFVVTLVPCAAVTVVIMGLVGKFLGLEWALALYALNLLVILVLGRLALKLLPGEPVGLIMEMPSYKVPALKNIAMASWQKLRSFVLMAFPIIIVSTFIIKLTELLGYLGPISEVISPITVGWLGLPAAAGIILIFGVLRKELTIIMLAALLGTAAFDTVLTPVQMITFAVVTMFYVPCAATMAALRKEQGLKNALMISAFEIAFAIVLAGIVSRLLQAYVFTV
jgi:ferrous iron transport protein B